MAGNALNNVNIISQTILPTPDDIISQFPLSARATETVVSSRQALCNILDGKDPRLFAVVGPCSIHDLDAAMEYAARLAKLAEQLSDRIMLIMRVYFEKPRTTVGWKGLINDPFMDDSFRIDEGLALTRKLLGDIAELGLPTGTEALDPITPQYNADLITWTAIGARTTESQTHREMASGLSTPVGFKNGTDGSVEVALNAMQSAAEPHAFLGINRSGQNTIVRTSGNRHGHLVLRGGPQPNYDSVSVALCEEALDKHNLPRNIVIDCSHANSHKKPELQPLVLENCINQVCEGNRSITGFMLESNIHEGNQSIPADLAQLKYGVSVTDACISWPTTERILVEAYNRLARNNK